MARVPDDADDEIGLIAALLAFLQGMRIEIEVWRKPAQDAIEPNFKPAAATPPAG